MSDNNTLLPAHIRAARGLLGWSQSDLAERARVSRATVADFERGARSPIENNMLAIRNALEGAGVAMEVGENGEILVKLKGKL